jgi:hypothetical protein
MDGAMRPDGLDKTPTHMVSILKWPFLGPGDER